MGGVNKFTTVRVTDYTLNQSKTLSAYSLTDLRLVSEPSPRRSRQRSLAADHSLAQIQRYYHPRGRYPGARRVFRRSCGSYIVRDFPQFEGLAEACASTSNYIFFYKCDHLTLSGCF